MTPQALDLVLSGIVRPAYIEIRSGPPPATCEEVDPGDLLCTLDIEEGAFEPCAIRLAQGRSLKGVVERTGVAGHWRLYERDPVRCSAQGTITLPYDGRMGTGTGDMIIDGGHVPGEVRPFLVQLEDLTVSEFTLSVVRA